MTIARLHPYYTYFCDVLAVVEDEGPFSEFVNVTTREDKPSGAPTEPKPSDVTSTSFTLSWEPPLPEERNGIITHYELRLEKLSCTQTVHYVTVMSSSLPFTVEDLRPDTTYNCSVKAATVNGTGPSSSPLIVTTLEDEPSDAPTEPKPSDVTSTSFTLSWEPPLPEERNGIITHYELRLEKLSCPHHWSPYWT
jgi:receptor-type tyrosine-protein phosphatase Q